MSLELEADTPAMADPEFATLQAMRPVPRISIQAFCETDAVMQAVERTGQDRRLSKVHLRQLKGGIDAAAKYYQTASTPNLLILESRCTPETLMEALASVAEVCDPSTKVVIIGHHNDISLYRELKRNGVSEYLVAPISMADLIGVVTGLFVDPDAKPLGRSIAFIGAKGGVGSSTLAHNISWAIASLFESEVIVADLDLAFGTANINFDQDPPQGIAQAVYSPDRIDEVYLDRLLAQCAKHLSLLAAPSSLERAYDFDAEAFTPIIDSAQRIAPTVILDLPHGWTSWIKTTIAQADDIVITVTPDLACLRNAKNLIDTLKTLRPNDDLPKLIINQVGIPKRPEIATADFVNPLGIPPIGVIPFDPQLFGTAANSGHMLGEADAKSPIAQTINEIAHILAGRREVLPKKKTGLAQIFNRLKQKQK